MPFSSTPHSSREDADEGAPVQSESETRAGCISVKLSGRTKPAKHQTHQHKQVIIRMTFSAALEIHQSDKLEAVQLLLQLYGLLFKHLTFYLTFLIKNTVKTVNTF